MGGQVRGERGGEGGGLPHPDDAEAEDRGSGRGSTRKVPGGVQKCGQRVSVFLLVHYISIYSVSL